LLRDIAASLRQHAANMRRVADRFRRAMWQTEAQINIQKLDSYKDIPFLSERDRSRWDGWWVI
jgi:hypothetical protein